MVCIGSRIVYIVKKGLNIFSKKGFFRGGAQLMYPLPDYACTVSLKGYQEMRKIPLTIMFDS